MLEQKKILFGNLYFSPSTVKNSILTKVVFKRFHHLEIDIFQRPQQQERSFTNNNISIDVLGNFSIKIYN